MYRALPFSLLLVGGASALKKVVHGDSSHRLLARQDMYCYTDDTCSGCFGEGNVLCTEDTCYNPSDGEQCCADGSYCVGATDSCCGFIGGNPSPIGTDGVPGATSDAFDFSSFVLTVTTTESSSDFDFTATATGTAATSQPSNWDCYTDDTDEECCERGGSQWHWCSGGWPQRLCYRPSEGEVCCSDGNSCDTGPSCCADFGATAITPSPTTAASTSAPESTSDSDDDAFTATRPVDQTSRTVNSPTPAEATTTTAPTDAAASVGPMAAAALAAFGLVGLL
ncbi:hypothetical protein BDY21DRAFT_362887 [Lineolata rhizophorae]|uniref:Uncharacterized protein n=1 Tax=Lineolata rhizophorae TaxID=578093 RepID=A0A6A6P4J0_9PEZI|nr:hypothetical protein BDY21DRAFT_362887 [Lineolata rhizophorae]